MEEPGGDGGPIFRLGVVDGVVVGARGEDEQIGVASGTGDEVVSHRQAEETVAVSLDDEDGKRGIAQRFFSGPDRWDEGGQKWRDVCGPRGAAKRRKTSAEDEAGGSDAIEDGRCNSGSEREAEEGGWNGGGEVLEKFKCGNCVVFALEPVDVSGAAAVAGVIKNQRRDTGFSEEALDGEPLRYDFADSVTDEDGGLRWRGGRLDVDGVEQIFAAGDGVAGSGDSAFPRIRRRRSNGWGNRRGVLGQVARDAAEEVIAHLYGSAGGGEGGGEEDSMNGHRFELLAVSLKLVAAVSEASWCSTLAAAGMGSTL